MFCSAFIRAETKLRNRHDKRLRSALTVLAFASFVGIVAWAWSGRRKAAFDAAARLPLEDDDAHMLRRAPAAGGKTGE